MVECYDDGNEGDDGDKYYDDGNAGNDDNDDLESRPRCAGGLREARWRRSRGS